MTDPGNLSAAEHAAVLEWLAEIGETNPENIKSTLEKSRANAKVLAWFLEKSNPAVKSKLNPINQPQKSKIKCFRLI